MLVTLTYVMIALYLNECWWHVYIDKCQLYLQGEYTMQQDTADELYTIVFSLKHYINWILNYCIWNTQTSSSQDKP